MTGLTQWEDPRTIRVTVPPLACTANGCEQARKADMIWHDLRAGQLYLEHVCGFHLFALRGRGLAVFMPLDTAPPLPSVTAAVQAEMARRRPVFTATTIHAGYVSGFNIRWG